MATELRDPAEVDFSTSQRSLLLVWQNPQSRRFIKVGRLDFLADSRFAFRYLPDGVADPEFSPLDDYPNTDAVYVSDDLPAFFHNRVMSASRPSYEQYLGWLGVDDAASAELPIELLARTGGKRATDTFHIVDVPAILPDRFSSRFFVSGIRHLKDPEDALNRIESGSRLELQLDLQNSHNPLAVLVNAVDGTKIGFVPDWLCEDVHHLVSEGWSFEATAEKVNRSAPAHVKVLCRVDARRP